MTATTALKLAIFHWTWLAKHPEAKQDDFLGANNWICDCILCSYDNSLPHVQGNICGHCPMVNQWPNSEGKLVQTCVRGSIYTERRIKYGIAYDKCFHRWLMVEIFKERLQVLSAQQ